MKKKLCPELQDIAERIGEFTQYWGFKKIHGRIWANLFLSTEPLDASCLMDRLKISKALVSMSVKDMLEYEVILEAGKSGKGTQQYTTNPDITTVILNVLRKRERRMLSQIFASSRLLKELPVKDLKEHKLDAEKVKTLGDMVQCAEDALDAMMVLGPIKLDSWKELEFATK
jgi:DNA-binding transcriptional regulator GbsR (MarR family)